MSTPAFKLSVDGLNLTLVEFDGVEEMNRLFKYSFTTEIPVSGEKLINMIDGDAIFTVCEFDTSLQSGDIEIPGYISKASKSNSYWVLEFSPKLHKTTTNSRSEIYFKEDASLTALSVIDTEFQDDILLNDRTPIFDISSSLPTRKLFCQFHESNLNFVARLCDHWGFHFYFDHYTSQIVFADNNQYDQKLTTEFKTSNVTADNSPIKILNWQETLQLAESYTTIIGYDHANAGTAISSSFPEDSNSQAGLTEVSQTLSDINSQAEADYIAMVRQEANNCLNHLASGQIKIPYVHPGFLINTDDPDFSSAFIIKTTNKGRNLNSANSGTAASFTCDFQAIPEAITFRPNTHYPIPTATNVIGKVVSETDNINQAQRNNSGEYKAELLGFDNESSAHPWLRKAQTTASNNSVDIPLTPNTEVLIAFIDNNPNCPYIQHALDNSLHPSPVTNANPHHAIISTHGVLVTSSLGGRYNYSTTNQHSESDDSTLGPSIKNYFTDRGGFDQNTNFIDPSNSSTLEFSDQDENSGDLLFTRHYGDSVEIREGDKLHWHNGNLYDFGGYWNYNLGNSYEENYLNQASKLNQIEVAFPDSDVTVADIMKTGGPAFEEIEWPSINDKLDLADSDHPFTQPADPALAPFYKDNVNTSKSYASNFYDFSSKCNSIDISDRCSSLDITHLDGQSKSVDVMFKNGRLRSLEKSQHRFSSEKKWGPTGKILAESETKKSPNSGNFEKVETKEKSWTIDGATKISESSTIVTPNSVTTDDKSYNMDTGALSSHTIKTTNGMASAEMDFSFDASTASKFNFGASSSFSLSAQADASIAISLSGSADISIGFGASAEIKTGLEASINLDLRVGIEAEVNSKGKVSMSATGFIASAESRAEAEQKALKMKSLLTELDKTAMVLAYTDVKLMNVTLQLKAGLELTGL